jgi:N6-L-threonylcarbamoyladenine synthase
LARLVVAGGVGANRALRRALDAAGTQGGFEVFFPEQELCTDNGAMIAFAAAQRLRAAAHRADDHGFTVRPRWSLESLPAP